MAFKFFSLTILFVTSIITAPGQTLLLDRIVELADDNDVTYSIEILRAILNGLNFYSYIDDSLACDANLVQYVNHWIDGIEFAE